MSNYVTYCDLLKDRYNFRKSGGRYSSEFNYYDTPSHKFFKLFFYFNNGDVDGMPTVRESSGLLAPTWLLINDSTKLNDSTYHQYNSAWSYFMMNADHYRAILLQKFVNLLSNISAESPWYFSELVGLDSAMDRKAALLENFTISPERPKLTIKCLPDSVDDRIGTLLDLYRFLVWDWTTKRETLPANLRKFDMGILIFETPTAEFNVGKIATDASKLNNQYWFKQMGIDDTPINMTSFKYIELHNCEIDYNSTKNVYSLLNNKEGTGSEYNLEIYFDDCYETRYNEFLDKNGIEFGDLLNLSLLEPGSGRLRWDYNYNEHDTQLNKLPGRNNISGTFIASNYDEIMRDVANNQLESTALRNKDKKWKTAGKFREAGFLEELLVGTIGGAAKQVGNYALDYVSSTLKKAVLGNLYTFSLTNVWDQIKSASKGNVVNTAQELWKYKTEADQRNENGLDLLNIFKKHGEVYDPLTGFKTDNIEAYSKQFQTVDEIGSLNTSKLKSEETPTVQNNRFQPTTLEAQTEYKNQIGQIMQDDTLDAQLQMKPVMGSMWRKKIIKPKVKYIGNLYEGNTIANNI